MQVITGPAADPVCDDGTSVIRALVTVRMTDAEYEAADGLRFEVFPAGRSRLKTGVKAEPLGDPVHDGGTWVIGAVVTVRVPDAGYPDPGGLRYEVFGWSRFRLKIRPGAAGTWCYEVRDLDSGDDDEDVIVRRGDARSWDLALSSGQAEIRELRWSMLGRRTL